MDHISFPQGRWNRVRDGVIERKTDTGTMKMSSPELTAFDLFRYIHVAGGVDAVATVVKDLGGKIDGEKLAAMAVHFDRACVQRLGYLLDRLGHADRAQALHSRLTATKPVPWVALEPPKRGDRSVGGRAGRTQRALARDRSTPPEVDDDFRPRTSSRGRRWRHGLNRDRWNRT